MENRSRSGGAIRFRWLAPVPSQVFDAKDSATNFEPGRHPLLARIGEGHSIHPKRLAGKAATKAVKRLEHEATWGLRPPDDLSRNDGHGTMAKA